MAKQAFALKEGAQDTFVDASVALSGDVGSLAVGELLDKGKGVIVIDDEKDQHAAQKIDALNTLDVLKQVSASEAADIAKAAKAQKEDDR